MHTHQNASRTQKLIKAHVVFTYVKTGNEVYICDKCQQKVIAGFCHGQMYD